MPGRGIYQPEDLYSLDLPGHCSTSKEVVDWCVSVGVKLRGGGSRDCGQETEVEYLRDGLHSMEVGVVFQESRESKLLIHRSI